MVNKHTFALFFKELSSTRLTFAQEDHYTLSDFDLIYRIVHVLRLSGGDQLILFDGEKQLLCVLEKITKKEILLKIMSVSAHTRKGIPVTVLLPILKKEDFDASLYALGAVGIDTIQLVTTEKTQRSWNHDKDYPRAEKILVAAAEQSKYFSMPKIHDSQPLAKIIENSASDVLKIVADPQGMAINNLWLDHKNIHAITMLVGPEGGLTDKELVHAQQHGFLSYRLTPTILKAEHAITIMSGIVRSVFY